MLDPQLEQKKALLSDFRYLPTVTTLINFCKITEEMLLGLDLGHLMAVLERSTQVVFLCENNRPFSFSELCQLNLRKLTEILDNANDIFRMFREHGAVSLGDFMRLSDERRALLLKNSFRVDYLITYCKVSFKELTELDLDFLVLLLQENYSAVSLISNHVMTISDLAQFERDRVRVFLEHARAVQNLVSTNNIPLADLVLVHPARLAELHNNPDALNQVIVQTKESINRLGKNAELTGNAFKRDVGFFGWVPCEMRTHALVYSRDAELVTPRDAKAIVLKSMYNPK